MAKMSFGFSGGDGSGRRDSSAARRGIKLDPDFTPVLRYNRVDALFAGGMVNLDVGEHIRLGAGGGLSTGLGGDDRWSHSGSIRVESAGRNRLSVAMNYSSGTEPRYTTNRYGSFVNSIYTVLGGRDYFDYYRSEGFSGRVGFSPDFATVELTTGYNDERHTSLAQTTSYDLAASRPLRPNVAVDEGRLRSLVGHLAIGDDASGQVQAVTQRRIDMEAEWSPGSLGGDFDFAQYQISADWAFTTFYPRRLLPNVLQLRVIAGTSTGELPLQRRGIVDGGMSIYQPFGVLHTLDGRPYEGDSYLGVFWEHNFRTVPFELLGLYGPARRGYSILVFGGHGHTRLGGDVSGFRVAKDWHHEIGMSLSGILGVLRVDIAKRLDASGFAVGAGFARLF
jgi:hypothetical protein